ncbi:tetratricopeptide repeat protein [Limnoglobus roseus]|uniref:Tetratricopeptide repeat protein n=1 Tax=Limnoglobus roseus TaxID=2598579 RepID=A0A5C1ADH6_9BACT|nr:hypothetical protein [Limnoglobus roseus]QEL16273.1 tetratricopeptide repeat protein [Limnoglobus roseus]
MNSSDAHHYAAAEHLWGGRPNAARDAALSGLQLNPDHAGLHELAGLAEFEQECYGPAVFHFESASVLAPLGTEAQLALADCYLRFGQTHAAGTIYAFLAEEGRCPTTLLPEVAKGLGRLARYELALKVCQRMCALRPTFHPAWFGVAYYLRKLRRPARLLVFPLQTAFELVPQSWTYRLNLLMVFGELGQLPDHLHLLDGVPVEALNCRCLCGQLAAAFATAEDHSRAAEFLARADSLTGRSFDADSETFDR